MPAIADPISTAEEVFLFACSFSFFFASFSLSLSVFFLFSSLLFFSLLFSSKADKAQRHRLTRQAQRGPFEK